MPIYYAGTLTWRNWPLGANGWRDFSVTTDATYPSPQYARRGSVVFVRGALDGAISTGALGALDADCRPAKRARMIVTTSGGIASLEMRTDGIMRDTAGGDLSTTAYIILAGCYVL